MSELAILGGSKTRTESYPDWPVWDQRDIDAVIEVIKSGRWGGYPYPGPKTAELAKKFAELQGGGYAVPMTNGTITMEEHSEFRDVQIQRWSSVCTWPVLSTITTGETLDAIAV